MTNLAEKIVARAEFLDGYFKMLAEDPPKGREKHVEFLVEVFAEIARVKRERGPTAAVEAIRRTEPLLEVSRFAIQNLVEGLRLFANDKEVETAVPNAVRAARLLIDRYGA